MIKKIVTFAIILLYSIAIYPSGKRNPEIISRHQSSGVIKTNNSSTKYFCCWSDSRKLTVIAEERIFADKAAKFEGKKPKTCWQYFIKKTPEKAQRKGERHQEIAYKESLPKYPKPDILNTPFKSITKPKPRATE